MAFQMTSPLPPAPQEMFAPDGQPRLGAFQGSVPSVDLRGRLGAAGWQRRLRQLVKLKRWCWGGIATQEVFVGFAVVDAGLAANGFAFAIDLAAGDRLADRSVLGLPGMARLSDRPGEGLSARLATPGTTMNVARTLASPTFQAEIRSGDFVVEATLDARAAPDPLAVLMPVKNGDLDFTQKTTLMPVSGILRVGKRMWPLDGGFGGLDFTHGLFARLTAWRWAFALGRATDGTPVAFNLAEGISDAPAGENAVWIDRSLSPVAVPRFMFDAAHLDAPWQVQTPDGTVDLRFTSKGMHREDRDYIALQSRFAQVAGLFSGTIRGAGGKTLTVEGLPGVVEDQRVLW
jgi:hypothetical protein